MNNKQLVLNIKKLCGENNIALKSLLERLKLSPSFISDINTKGVTPSIKRIELIADYFNVSIDYLIGRTEQPTKIEQNVSHNTLNDQSIGINNVQNIENSISKELLTEFEKLSFKDKSYIMSMIAELNEPTKNDAKIVASPSRVEPPKVLQKNIEDAKKILQELDEEQE